jgi:steroid 5-alpha reductase family enzyme
MSYFPILVICVFLYMTFWFGLSIVKKRNDIADIAWGLGFVLLSWLAYYVSDESSLRALGVNLLVTIWGLRLAWHIYERNKGKSEDYRYAAWRREWGRAFYLRSFLQVYLLQGFFLFLISLPVLITNQDPGSSLSLLDIIGLLIWTVGFLFETVGDAQLAHFIKNPKNKDTLMQQGLWRYTRHPNYFGEVTQWWGIWLISLSNPGGIYGLIGPLTITILILKVSGIPLLEKKYQGRADYEAYKKQTSIFFPLPPKKTSLKKI